MGRFERSWHLTKRSYRILMKDKELLVLPVVSGLAILVVSASFMLPLGITDPDGVGEGRWALLGVLFYIVTYTISFFFQAAVVAGATQRMKGEDPTLGTALGAAGRRFGSILVWGVIAGTVGWLIKAIQERSNLLGKIVMGLIGVAWSLATFFMAPVLVLEQEGIGSSFRRSWETFKKTWGETVVGTGGIGLVFFLLGVGVVAVAVLIGSLGVPILALVVAVVGLLGLAVVGSALQGVYVAALYRYATTGEVPTGYDSAVMESAFAQKTRLKKVFE